MDLTDDMDEANCLSAKKTISHATRKIIQLLVKGDTLFGLADHGSVWMNKDKLNGFWELYPLEFGPNEELRSN